MYIEEVKIKNFMSIKGEVIWSDFHPGFNVIAGENGSGKSTFLRAIRFIFTNDFSCLTQHEKQTILNDQRKPARVDITIFDPEDRFLLEMETLKFSRQIELKKDLLFVNNKRTSKLDFFKLLESARISSKRPFYVVRQGEATKLANLSNKERLEIFDDLSDNTYLKESALEINKLDKQFEIKAQFLEETLQNFEDNLEFLGGKIEELKMFKRLKKQVDCITRVLANRQIEKIANNLQTWDQKAMELQTRKIEVDNQFCEIVNKHDYLINCLKSLENELQIGNNTRHNLSVKMQINEGNEFQIEYKIKDFEKQLETFDEQEKKVKTTLEQKIRQIAELEEERLQNIPQYERTFAELENINQQLALNEVQVNEIYAKKLRGRQFSNKTERDSWIHNEMFVLNEQKVELQAELEDLNHQIESDENTRSEFTNKIETLENQIAMQKSKMAFNFSAFEYLMKQMSDNAQKLADLRDQQNEKEKILLETKSELTEVQQKFRKVVSKKIYDAMTSVQRVLEVFRDRDEDTEGYHGLLIDNFRLKEPAIQSLLEYIAGNRLFHHVVETEALATRIIDEMNILDLPGEANFFPLDRLRFLEKNIENENVINLLTFLDYDYKLDGAIRYVFGNKFICKDVSIALQMAREHNVDCFTIDGEQASSNGLLSGGFMDSSKTREKIYRNKVQLEENCKILENDLEEIENKIKELNQTKIVAENKIISPKIERAEDILTKMKMDLETMNSESNCLLERISEQKKLKNGLELKLKLMESKIAILQNDLNEELDSQLTDEEEKQLKNLQTKIVDLRKQREKKRKMVDSWKEKTEKIENQLEIKLKVEVEQMKEKIEIIGGIMEKLKRDIGDLKLRLIGFQNDTVSKNFHENHNRVLKELNEKIKKAEKELKEVKQNRAKLEKTRKTLEEEIKNIDLKIMELKDQQEKCEEEIRGASFASSTDRDFENQSTQILVKKLDNSKKKLRKINSDPRTEVLYDKVNNFKNEFQIEFEKSKLPGFFTECVTEMKILDNEVMEEEFTKFSENFDKYFQKFMPNARGELIEETNNLNPEADEISVGIDIHVTSSGGEQKNLKSLSGGEKSSVSLAFIFAAAENNPPPFFIFDEVDAALSEANSIILATILKEFSQDVQIFASTFNPQMMASGDRFFKVTTLNSVSKIETVFSVGELI